jgi:hypothetical protein
MLGARRRLAGTPSDLTIEHVDLFCEVDAATSGPRELAPQRRPVFLQLSTGILRHLVSLPHHLDQLPAPQLDLRVQQKAQRRPER